jgi:predicted ATPase/class 3 adenylate cyclase
LAVLGERSLPTGTVSFLFSDIEGSTVRWDKQREAMQAAVRRHDELMRAAIEGNAGHVFKTIGDAFCAAFGGAPEAIAGALAAQRAIAAESWTEVEGLRVRMAIHTGVADERENDYFGPTVNRVARLLSIGHGAQVLVSGAASALLEGHLPPQTSLVDMGMHRLKDLSAPEHVYQLRASDLTEHFPPLRSLDALPNNLPAQLTPLVGRDEEVAAIARLLHESRVVTLIGSGGIGKTRTALQVAADLAHDDGSWFVNLASIDDPALVPSAIAAVFNIPDEGGSQRLVDRIGAALKMKTLLIVLDNCEHVIAAAAEAVDAIVQTCPDVRFLATSREPLAIGGESLYRIPLLAVPPEDDAITAERLMQYPAAALFCARAKAAQQSFLVTDQNASLVAQIVRRLDGIALAIELAAPRIKVLTLGQLHQRLDDQLKLLTGGSRNALPRQQTLRALISWSYDLLGEAERSMLRQAAIFRGSWTLEAAEAVWSDDGNTGGDVLDLVAALADKSLLVVDGDPDGDQRYRLLESTRGFALERLTESGEADGAAERHCGYYAGLADDAGVSYWTIDTDLWMANIRRDLDNCRQAIHWGLLERRDVEAAVTAIAGLRWLWESAARREGRDLVISAISALPADAAERVRALLAVTASILAVPVADADPGSEIAALANPRDAAARAEYVNALANAAGDTGDFVKAIGLLEEALRTARSVSGPHLLGHILSSASYWSACAGDSEKAAAYAEEASPLIRRCNNLPALARLNVIRAELFFAEGDVRQALECARESEAIYRQRRHEGLMFCATLLNLAAYLIADGSLAQAWDSAHEAVALASRRDEPLYVAVAIGHLGRIASETGRSDEAARLLGFVDQSYSRLGNVREPTEKQSYDRSMEFIRGALPADRIVELMKTGAAMDQDAAVADAMAIPKPG